MLQNACYQAKLQKKTFCQTQQEEVKLDFFSCCCLLLHIKFNLLIVKVFLSFIGKLFFWEKCSVTIGEKRINFPYALKIKFYSGTVVWNRMYKYCYVRLQESLVSLVCNTSTKIKITIRIFHCSL